MEKTKYTFTISIRQIDKLSDERIAWIEQIRREYFPLMTYESGKYNVQVVVQEPSDFYVLLHNAYRRCLITTYTVGGI